MAMIMCCFVAKSLIAIFGLRINGYRKWHVKTIREGVKKTDFFGTLSQTSDPTHPPRTFGTPLSEK